MLGDDDGVNANSDTRGPVHVSRNVPVVYGNVAGDARPEAAVTVVCDNRGGTGSGVLVYAAIIFGSIDNELVVIGTVTPQRTLPSPVHPTVIEKVTLAFKRITVKESWYRSIDPTCCPSGAAITQWDLRGGELAPNAPRLVS